MKRIAEQLELQTDFVRSRTRSCRFISFGGASGLARLIERTAWMLGICRAGTVGDTRVVASPFLQCAQFPEKKKERRFASTPQSNAPSERRAPGDTADSSRWADARHSTLWRKHPVALVLAHHHQFAVGELFDAGLAQFASIAGAFDASERQTRSGCGWCIDEHHPGFNA